MSRAKTIIVNTMLLTAVSLLMRSVGMVFQVWLTRKIGAAGIGLFQLIMSVSMLAATFAISGIRFAATRLVSMELGAGNESGARAAVKRCLAYAFCFGTAASLFLWFGAPVVGGVWIGDGRTVLSLRVLSLSLTPYALSAVFAGYFTAVRRVVKSAAVSVAEQLIRILAIVIALGASAGRGLEISCAVVVAGGVAGEMSAFLMLAALYLLEKRGWWAVAAERGLTRRMLGIAAPLALSAYARSALSTLQHLLVPRGFKKAGASAEKALADYGTVHGMVFPILMFPSALFYSFAELVVPELTDAQVRGDKERISELVSRSLRLCLFFSVGFMACMWGFGNELGSAVYGSGDTGRYLAGLAWLMPIMYLDSVTDGMLRGLGQQMYCMAYNILDSAVSVTLVYLLLPRFALAGYVFMIAFTEIFNFALSLNRLRRVTVIRFSAGRALKSLLAAFGAVNFTRLAAAFLRFPASRTAAALAMNISLCFAIYAALLMLLGCLDASETAGVKNFFAGIVKRAPAWYTDAVKNHLKIGGRKNV
ncbi:MAG: polysaccharide biosynthesis C-terminal domain-containing protein [Oscillospiraceae bacterium]|jgi:stage V sporulation protein B|nr:polysaccharide biosynthesis C-terminal domain-containing protein [Oscillospiraceae bacterium]